VNEKRNNKAKKYPKRQVDELFEGLTSGLELSSEVNDLLDAMPGGRNVSRDALSYPDREREKTFLKRHANKIGVGLMALMMGGFMVFVIQEGQPATVDPSPAVTTDSPEVVNNTPSPAGDEVTLLPPDHPAPSPGSSVSE
jgi:hypothetical protein